MTAASTANDYVPCADYVDGIPAHDRPCRCETWQPRVIAPDAVRAWCGMCGGWIKGGPKEPQTVTRAPGRPRQERCARGHSLRDAYAAPSGKRQCRTCHRERQKVQRAYKPTILPDSTCGDRRPK